MFSVANLEAHNLSKDQMKEFLMYMNEHENHKNGAGGATKDAIKATNKNPKKQPSSIKKASSKTSNKSAKSINKSEGPSTQQNSKMKLFRLMSEEQVDDGELTFLKWLCCCRPSRKKKSDLDNETLILWRNKYCRTFDEFVSILKSTTRTTRVSIPIFNDIKRSISYQDDPTAVGLSTLGGLMWTLTYAIQHLIDPNNSYSDLNKDLIEIRAVYQEIGAAAQKFVNISEKFSTKMDEIQPIIYDVVKKLTKKYKFTKDPMSLRPEFKPKPGRIRKRIGIGTNTGDDDGGSGGTGIGKREDEGELFHVNWSPLTIIVQYPHNDDWEIYAALPIEEKLSLFKLFIKHALDVLENWIQKFNDGITCTKSSSANSGLNKEQVVPTSNSKTKDKAPSLIKLGTNDNKKNTKNSTTSTTSNTNNNKSKKKSTSSTDGEAATPEQPQRSQLFEIVNAMQNFVNTHQVSKNDEEKDTEIVQLMVEDFWFTMDSLYELSYEIEKLVVETRDIIRTCYVYSTNFYQWKLANYDSFDPKTKTKEYKANQKQMKAFMAKILGQRRFSDAAMFISLADFTSSIYQKVAISHESETKDGHAIKLNCWEDEETETWGLVK